MGLFESLGPDLLETAGDAIEGFVGFFIDPNQEGSLAGFIQRVNNEGFAAVFGDITSGIATWASDTIAPAVQGAVDVQPK